ncbi:hypothetical protein B224_1002 [Aeromonas media WS]|nr:hypothetical protein B224_1002 [Aeromonas media WS]
MQLHRGCRCPLGRQRGRTWPCRGRGSKPQQAGDGERHRPAQLSARGWQGHRLLEKARG